MISHLQIFYAMIKVKYFTANRELLNTHNTLKPWKVEIIFLILKTIILSEIPTAKHVNIGRFLSCL